MAGEMAQPATTREKPVHPQLILELPMEAMAAPMRPPRSECVGMTGSPRLVATVRNMEETMMVHIMPRRTAGASSKW